MSELFAIIAEATQESGRPVEGPLICSADMSACIHLTCNPRQQLPAHKSWPIYTLVGRFLLASLGPRFTACMLAGGFLLATTYPWFPAHGSVTIDQLWPGQPSGCAVQSWERPILSPKFFLPGIPLSAQGYFLRVLSLSLLRN